MKPQADLQPENSCIAPDENASAKQGSNMPGGGSRAEARMRGALWLLSACALGISFALAHSHREGPPCFFRAALHIPCPGCGLTRSFNALWHGDLLTSFRFHPLGLPLFILFTVYVLAVGLRGKFSFAQRISDGMLRSFHGARPWKITTCLLVGIWIARLCLLYAGNRYFLW